MLRVNGAYLYELGKTLQPINRLNAEGGSRSEFYFQCLWAKDALAGFLYASVFSDGFRASGQSASQLLKALEEISPDISDEIDWEEKYLDGRCLK